VDTLVRNLGLTDYEPVFAAMRAFTDARGPATADEIWFTEHHPVFTQGQAGRAEHVLAPGAIPVVRTDRGGQVTYHGPGQIVAYLMFDLRRRAMSVRDLVSGIERAVTGVLASCGIEGEAMKGAPGVYVAGRKIAALGLRVRRGCSYHGLSLNVDVELEPFGRINPCGFEHLEVTRIADFVPLARAVVRQRLCDALADVYGLSLNRSGSRDVSAA
jgi:lipoyl(octanoyl) transferase